MKDSILLLLLALLFCEVLTNYGFPSLPEPAASSWSFSPTSEDFFASRAVSAQDSRNMTRPENAVGLMTTILAILIAIVKAKGPKKAYYSRMVLFGLMFLGLPSCSEAYTQFENQYGSGAKYTGFSIAAIPGGGYYVASKYLQAGDTYSTAWIMKLNVAGAIVKEYRTCVANDEGMDIKYTADGGCVFISNVHTPSCASGSVFPLVVKLDADLGEQGRSIISNVASSGYAIMQLSTGAYAVAGANSGFAALLRSTLTVDWHSSQGSDAYYDVIEIPGQSKFVTIGKYTWGARVSGRFSIWEIGSGSGVLWYLPIPENSYFRHATYVDTNTVTMVGTITVSGVDQVLYVVFTPDGGHYRSLTTVYGTSPGYGMGIAKVLDDRFALLGYTSAVGAGGFDVWIRFTDVSPTTQWEWTFGSTSNDLAYGLDFTDDGAIAIAGTYTDPGTSEQKVYVIVKGYKCQPGTFLVVGSFKCENCGLGQCQPNYARTSCSSCNPGYYQDLLGQSACKKCPAGKSQSGYGKSSCVDCGAGTSQSLEGMTSCSSCLAGTFQDLTGQSSCKNCGLGTYQPYGGKTKCEPCPLMQYQDQEGWIACKACWDTKYQDETGQDHCKDCLANCRLCTTGTNCATCLNTYFKLTIPATGTVACENPCRDEYYGATSDYTCKSCLAHCKECTGPDRCGLCLPGYYRFRNGTSTVDLCMDKCPTYMYGNDTSRTCESCISRCPDCTNSTDCQRCDSAYYLDTLWEGVNQCINPCRDGYYNDPQNYCKSCLSGCKVCTNATRCLECFDPLALKHSKVPNTDTDTCVADCGLGYYVIPARVCLTCDFRCLSCMDGTANACPDCNFGIEGVAKTGAMSCDCGDGYTASPSQGKCLSCEDPLCMSCNVANLTQCYACSSSVPGIIYSPSRLSCTCVAGKYRDGDACASCNSLCSECSGPSNKECLPSKCNSAYKAYPLEGLTTTCLYMCKTADDNLFINSTTKTCQQCKTPCKSCFNGSATGCSSYIPGYLLLGSVCANSCPPKYYEDAGVCLPCDAKCKSCVGKTNYCINGCESPYFFKNHRCLADCGDAYTPVNGQCEECETDCISCYYDSVTSHKVCVRCGGGKLLYAGDCVQLCPNGYYPDLGAGECRLCSVECTRCLTAGNKACTACNTTLGYKMISPNVCDFPTCTRGTYFDRTERYDCRPECAECYAYDNCTACAKGYLLDPRLHSCYDECKKLGYVRLPVTFECVEICGDGRNMGQYQCDDGNSKDGDGCSASCKVEANFECSGGNLTNADVCINRRRPEFAALKYYGNRTGVLTFTSPVTFLDPIEKLVTVWLEGGEQAYVGWDYVLDTRKKYNRKVMFHFGFNYSLRGDETLVIRVNTLSQVQDANGNRLKYESIRTTVGKYKYVDSAYVAGADGVGTVSFYAMLFSIGLSLGISLVFNTPIEGMWAAMSVLQMMSYLTLLSLHFPENFLTFLGYIESVHNFNKWLPNAFTYLFRSQYLDLSPYNDQFNSRGFTSRNMLYLCGSDLVMMGAMGLAIIALIPLSNVLSVFDSILKKLRYSSLARSFVQSYLKICLASFVNIGVYAFDNPTSALSSLIAIITGCLLVGTPAFISEFLYQNHQLANEDKGFRTMHASYIAGFRVKANVLNLMFYPIFLFRRLAFAATITILADYPSLELALILVQTLAMAGYMYYWKPFRSKYTLYSSLGSEFMFAGCTALMFAFVSERSDFQSCVLGWLAIGMVVSSLLASWACVAAQQIRIHVRRKERQARIDAAKKAVEGKEAEEDEGTTATRDKGGKRLKLRGKAKKQTKRRKSGTTQQNLNSPRKTGEEETKMGPAEIETSFKDAGARRVENTTTPKFRESEALGTMQKKESIVSDP